MSSNAVKKHLADQDVADKTSPPDWSDIAKLRKSDFAAMVEKRQALKQQIATAEQEAKELSGKIQLMLSAAGIEQVRVADYRVGLVTSHTASKLSKERLVELGVSPKIIQKATIEGEEYQYLKVQAIKEAQ